MHIEMTQHVNLTFSLKYLVNFSKSASLSDTVQLMLKNDVPLLVSISTAKLTHYFIHLAPCRYRTRSARDMFGTISRLKSETNEYFAVDQIRTQNLALQSIVYCMPSTFFDS